MSQWIWVLTAVAVIVVIALVVVAATLCERSQENTAHWRQVH